MSFKDTALRLIEKEGQSCTYRSMTFGSNATEPWKTGTDTYTDYTVSMALVPNPENKKASRMRMSGSDVIIGKDLAYMGDNDFVPNVDDVVFVDGEERSILDIRSYRDRGSKVLYELELA